MKTIIAIASTFNEYKVYVNETFKTQQGKVGVELTRNKNIAKDFETVEKAEAIIKNINNPFNRKYKAVEVEIEKPVYKGERTEELL